MTGSAGVVDAHVHQWDPFTTPRIAGGPARLIRRAPFLSGPLFRPFPLATRQFVADPQYVLNPYLPADYRADSAPAGVDTVVHIECEWQAKTPIGSVDETRWIAALPFGAAGAPRLGGIVVHANPADAEVGAVLDAHLAASPLVRGVRCLGANSPDPGVMSYVKSPGLLADPAFLRGFAAIAERDLTFDVWVYAHQLPDVAGLVREYPQTTFVLDHYLTPAGALGPRGKHTGVTPAVRRDIIARWRDDIAALAEFPNVVAKHSGYGMPVLGLDGGTREQRRDAIAPLATHVHGLFGSTRTFWSSNFPMDKPNITVADSIWILRDILGDQLDEAAMFGDNARRVYRID